MSNPVNVLYEFEIFRLDINKKILWADNKIVELPLKAVETLCVLIEQKGEVVGKDELLERVWQESFVEESNLSQHIYLLRKIFKDFGVTEDLIKTIPRRGYCFVGDVAAHSGDASNRKETNQKTGNFEKSQAKSSKKHVFTALAFAFLLLVVASAAFWQMKKQKAINETKTIKTIAVLPFHLAKDVSDEALSLEFQDTIITKLSKLSMISVRSTISVLRFENSRLDAINIGKQLEVDAVLVGRIQKNENRLRVTLQLVKISTEESIWSDQFDGDTEEILAFQDRISTGVITGLQISLTETEQKEFRQNPSESEEAMEAYSRGFYFRSKRNKESFEKALVYYRKAVESDPNFALAYVGLADTYMGFYDYGFRPAEESIPQMREALDKALELNPNLPEAHSSKAYLELIHDWDWQNAERSFLRSLELKPNLSTTHLNYGWGLTLRGNFEQALRQFAEARKTEPVSPIISSNIAYAHFCSGNYDQAKKDLLQAIEAHPDFSLPHWFLGLTYLKEGRNAEAYRKFNQAAVIENEKELAAFFDQIAEPDKNEAEIAEILRQLEKRQNEKNFSAYLLAKLYALLKDREKSLIWLEKAYRQKDPWLLQVRFEPEFDFLRDDESFKAVLKKISL